jgi:acyl-CoA reductase-like NAD-dependent aldehyde dehydrogenase
MTTNAAAGNRIVSRNPADGSVVGELPAATRDEVRAAVERARAAQPAWAALPFEQRAAAFLAAAPLLEAAAEELGSLVHREMGKPLASAIGEARGVAQSLAAQVEIARAAVAPQEFREEGAITVLRHDALGVVACVTPWNFPLWVPLGLLAPALLTGNAVVHKPSEKTPLAGRRFTEILAGALPPGVLEHVAGGGDVGRELVESDVQMVAFTGSQDTGRAIMAACAKGLKRLVLELGGKDPMLVLADADLEKAAQFATTGSFRNSGQVCCSVERIFVERAIAERFTARVVELAKETSIGPLADEGQRDKVARQVESAVRDGAKVLLGGSVPSGPGAAYPPTVVTDITDDMDIARRETFGPVACIRVVDDADEAVRLANSIDYGLGATVWTGDAVRGEAVASRLQSAMIGINRGIRGVGDSPWVGARGSGFGFTGSIAGARQFTQVRTITRGVEA